MTMLAEMVDVVIGVDTHKQTHTAAVVTAATGGVVAELTIDANPGGDEELASLADVHGARRVWAIEGTGSFGSGLTRFLQSRGERVVELDRPWRPRRQDGAKNDSINAVRAARGRTGPREGWRARGPTANELRWRCFSWPDARPCRPPPTPSANCRTLS